MSQDLESKPVNTSDVSIPDAATSFDERFVNLLEDMDADQNSVSAEVQLADERYVIGDLKGSGGLKNIYVAYDRKSGREVALAQLKAQNTEENTELFLREARMTALLEHPNIIPVYDVGFNDEPFFTMKLIQGKSLAEIIFKDHEYSLLEMLRNFNKICDAIAYAHSRGIVHLDLKPENIFFDGFGEVIVLDWGISRRLYVPEGDKNTLEADLYETSKVVGTPGTMAPEQIDVENLHVDERTDVYSLGVILYEVLTREKPVEGDGLTQVIKSTLDGKVIPPSIRVEDKSIPSSLCAVVMKAMDAKPENRYSSVSDLQKDLNRYLDGFATEAEEASFLKLLSLLVKRNSRVVLSLAVVFIVSFVLISYFIWELNKSEQETRHALELVQSSQASSVRALKKAEENLKKFKDEQKTKYEIGEYASEILAKDTVRVPFATDIEEARRRVELAVQANPNSPKVHRTKFLFHMVNQEFFNVIAEYPFIDKNAHNDELYRIAVKYSQYKSDDEKLGDEHFRSLLKELSQTSKKWVASSLLFYYQKGLNDLDKKIAISKLAVELINPKVKTWKTNYIKGSGNWELEKLSLAGNKAMQFPFAIIGMSIKELDLSKIKHVHLSNLNLASVHRVVLTDTDFIVKDLLYKKVQEVVIRKGQLKAKDVAILDYFYDIIEVE